VTLPTITLNPPRRARLASISGYLAPVVRSEWHKLRTSRSTWWTAGVAGAASVILGALHCRSIASAAHPPSGVDALGASLFGLSIGQFVVAVAGVLIITGEYSSGTIRLTLIATPQRTRLLTAKVLVIGSAAFAYGLIIAITSYGICQAILAPHHLHAALLTGLTIRRLLGAAVIFPAMALIGFGCGTLARHTAAGLVGVGAALLLPGMLLDTLTAAARQHISRFLPLRAADALVQSHPSAAAFRPLAALGVLAAEIAVLLAAGVLLLVRRDA
jgi:ABC-2 type transport system permease protein